MAKDERKVKVDRLPRPELPAPVNAQGGTITVIVTGRAAVTSDDSRVKIVRGD